MSVLVKSNVMEQSVVENDSTIVSEIVNKYIFNISNEYITKTFLECISNKDYKINKDTRFIGLDYFEHFFSFDKTLLSVDFYAKHNSFLACYIFYYVDEKTIIISDLKNDIVICKLTIKRDSKKKSFTRFSKKYNLLITLLNE